MFTRSAYRLAICTLWSLSIVCSANAEIFRGQNPAAQAGPRPVAVQPLNAAYPAGYHIRGVRRAGSPQQGHALPIRQASNPSPHMPVRQVIDPSPYLPVRQYGQGYAQGPVVYGAPYADTNCPDYRSGHGSHGGGYEPGWSPTHQHYSTYDPPKGLSYPPSQVPAGFVQYPYYTLKGPSDFFMK